MEFSLELRAEMEAESPGQDISNDDQEPPSLETDAGDITGVGTATRTRCGQRTPCQY